MNDLHVRGIGWQTEDQRPCPSSQRRFPGGSHERMHRKRIQHANTYCDLVESIPTLAKHASYPSTALTSAMKSLAWAGRAKRTKPA